MIEELLSAMHTRNDREGKTQKSEPPFRAGD